MHEIDKARFGAIIAAARKERGMTQKDLAQKLFISDKAVSKWETGAASPDLELLPRLAVFFDSSIDELLDYREKLLAAVEAQHDHICRRIDRNGKLLDRDKADILASAQEFAARWLRGGHGEAPDGER